LISRRLDEPVAKYWLSQIKCLESKLALSGDPDGTAALSLLLVARN
jgi:hypothetical protein